MNKRTCVKIRYLALRNADRHRRDLEVKTGLSYDVYVCPGCACFHVGRSQQWRWYV